MESASRRVRSLNHHEENVENTPSASRIGTHPPYLGRCAASQSA